MPPRHALTLLVLFSTGCHLLSTREPTSWLRARRECEYDWLAIALPVGHRSSGVTSTTAVERRRGERWEKLVLFRPEGFVFDKGRRALFETGRKDSKLHLLTSDGRDIPLLRDREYTPFLDVRLSPQGEIVCVDPYLGVSEPDLARVTAFDFDGRERRHLEAAHPVRNTDPDLHFVWKLLGFAGDELVFVVHVLRHEVPEVVSYRDPCRAYALDRNGTWRGLGSLSPGRRAYVYCEDEALWTLSLGLPISRGTEIASLGPPGSCFCKGSHALDPWGAAPAWP